MPIDRRAEQDVPNTAESKQKHVYLVRNAVLCSSRYKQYSDADKNNVRILLDGLEQMYAKFDKPAEVSAGLLGAYENYYCGVSEVLRRYEEIENMPKTEIVDLRPGRSRFRLDNRFDEASPRKFPYPQMALFRYLSLSFPEKREQIKSQSLSVLYQILQRSKDRLTGYCSDESVELLGRSLCKSACTEDVSLDKAFENLHRAEELLKDRYGGPVFDDHRRILH